MSVLLQAKFRHVGHPAALGGHNNNEVFPASARIYKIYIRSSCATSRSISMEMSSPPTLALKAA